MMPVRLLVVVLASLMMLMPLNAQDPVSPTCPTSESLTVGLQEITFTVDDVTRNAFVYVPETYNPATPSPLVMSFHGFASNPQQQRVFSLWDTLADEHGFIVVYPQGTGFPLRWNSGALGFGDSSADDVAYVGVLIDTLSQSFCIDPARVYANGLSNGGGMSHRLACELSDRIAAVGGVAGYYTLETCEPSRAVPVIAFHGDNDPIVPIEGTQGIWPTAPIADWVAGWVARNNCQTTETLDPIGTVSITRYTDCTDNADVVYYRVGGGGHTWPIGGDAQPEIIMGPINRDVDASVLMWEFFSRYTLPQAK